LGTLTVTAAKEAGLKANTTYNVTVKVDMVRPSGNTNSTIKFYNSATPSTQHTELWPGKTDLTFSVTTDANGAFTSTWKFQVAGTAVSGVVLESIAFNGITIA
jgi:hypothetical protein